MERRCRRHLKTVGEHGVSLAIPGQPEVKFGDWYVIGLFGKKLSDRSNAATIIDDLQLRHGEEAVHWAIDRETQMRWVIVDPKHDAAVDAAMGYMEDLAEGVHVLNDDHYSQMIATFAEKAWEGMTLHKRRQALEDCGLPSVLARNRELPDEARSHLEDQVVEEYD